MTIKSQDDLNKPETHSTEVLLSTIEKLERTKKQLKIAVEALEDYAESDNWELENEKYIYWEKKGHSYPWRLGLKALKEIKELDNANRKMDNMD